MKITKEELARGNIDFVIAACMKLGFDDGSFYQTLRRANMDFERARYDGLQESNPAQGYLFVDPIDAGELIQEISSDERIFFKFMDGFNRDLTREGKFIKNDEATLIQMPFENRYGKFSIGLNIFGYTLGRPTFEEVINPYELPERTFMERLAEVKLYRV